MPNPTPARIEGEAISHYRQVDQLGEDFLNPDRRYGLVILAALEAAEKRIEEISEYAAAQEEKRDAALARSTSAEARCKELERVGNIFAKEHHQEPSCDCVLCKSVRAWTALVNTH